MTCVIPELNAHAEFGCAAFELDTVSGMTNAATAAAVQKPLSTDFTSRENAVLIFMESPSCLQAKGEPSAPGSAHRITRTIARRIAYVRETGTCRRSCGKRILGSMSVE